MTPLTVTLIDHESKSETMFTLGKRKISIPENANVLVEDGFVTVQQVKKGDRILAWGLAKPPMLSYNTGVKPRTKKGKANGKRNVETLRK